MLNNDIPLLLDSLLKTDWYIELIYKYYLCKKELQFYKEQLLLVVSIKDNQLINRYQKELIILNILKKNYFSQFLLKIKQLLK